MFLAFAAFVLYLLKYRILDSGFEGLIADKARKDDTFGSKRGSAVRIRRVNPLMILPRV